MRRRPPPTSPPPGGHRSLIPFFLRLCVVVFCAEFLVMMFLPVLLPRADARLVNFVDALLLVVLSGLPLWVLVLRPLRGEFPGTGEHGSLTSRVFGKVLIIIFCVELLIMFLLPAVIPPSARVLTNVADAVILTFLCAPFVWALLKRALTDPAGVGRPAHLLGPFALFTQLLMVIFCSELITDAILPDLSTSLQILTNSLSLTLLLAPFIWWLVAWPLRRVALEEKSQLNAVRAQVVDAIVMMDENGVIASLNPAAERIFGIVSAQTFGMPVEHLLDIDAQTLEGFAAGASPAVSAPGQADHEVTGRHRDGRLIPMEMSVSRVTLADARYFMVILRDISERKRAEERRLKAISLLEATLEATADAIVVVDSDRTIQTYNGKFQEMLKVPRSILDGRDSRLLLTHTSSQSTDPAAYAARVEELYAHPGMEASDLIRFRDGRAFRRHSRSQRINGDIVGRVWSFSEITSQERAMAALRESEARFRTIFEQTEDAIVLLQLDSCQIIDVNPTAERLYGYSREELMAGGLDRFCHPDELATLQAAVCRIDRDRSNNLDQLVCVRKGEEEIIVSVRAKQIVLEGEVVSYCTFRDITERVRMEEAARDIQARLIQTNKMTSLGVLVSSVAHEINNPNNYILANSRLLSRIWQDVAPLLEEYARENGEFQLGGLASTEVARSLPELLEGISDGSRRIREIVNNLKDFSRAGRSALDGRVDLNRVVGVSATILGHQIRKHTDSFHLELGDGIPEVRGSSQQLEQVVINLIVNACQALTDRHQGIWLTTFTEPGRGEVCVRVRDEGCGMPDDVRARVLEPFFTTRLDAGGTGLGLAISISIIAEHGGTLDIQSTPGAGSTFTVRLPTGHLSQGETPSCPS